VQDFAVSLKLPRIFGADYCDCHRSIAEEFILQTLREGESVVLRVKAADDETVNRIGKVVARFETESNKSVEVRNVGNGKDLDRGKDDTISPSEEVSSRFEYRKPSENGVKQIELVREHCRRLALLLETELPDCREKSLAITRLEEVSMWANKASAFHVK
jgi:hypothetical protein